MKYISICSGIEAATVAFHGFGWTPLAFSEIEAFPSAVLAARWPQVPNLGDMTKFAEWPEDILAECDLLVGGPPCQAFSVAGLRKSLDDDRGNITLAYVRLLNHIDEVRKRHGRPPAIAVYENVPGLLSTKDNAFGCLIGALAGCDEAPETETGKWPKAGYVCGETRRVGYRILDAQFFGVAQRRRRIFLVAVPCELVASLGDDACPSEILSLRESVRGNPPSRSKAGQGTAAGTEGRPRGGGEPVPDRNRPHERGVNAVGVSGQCAGTLDSHYFKGCGSAAFGEREVVATVHPCLDANVDAKWGSNQWVDGGFPILESFGGNNTSGPVDAAAALLAHGGPAGRLDFASETFAVVPEVANPLTHRMHKGMNTTVDEGQTPIVTTGGGFNGNANAGGQVAVAYGMRGDAGREGVAKTPSADAEGRFRLRNPSFNPLEELSPTMDASQPHAVAFTQNQREEVRVLDIASACSAEPGSHQQTYIAQPAVAYVKATNPHSKEEAPRYEEAAVSACLNGWDERHEPPKHMVAVAVDTYNQTIGDTSIPVRVGNAKDSLPAVLIPAVAFANRTRDGMKVPEIMKDGVVPALTNPGGGGRADAVNVCLPTPLQEVSKRTGKSTDDPRAGIGIGSAGDPMYTLQAGAQHGCHSSMQVRRLTPSECEYLQGFPSGHTDIVFRKKPAADGPRYRALGNSMAVPCMVWLGCRIHKATKGDTE
jgi:DNA (cytosine-5)-methyltransferase 1